MNKPVLFCYDGSEGSRTALRAAVEWIKPGGDAVVLTVWTPAAVQLARAGSFVVAIPNEGEVDEHSRVEGRVVIAAGAKIVRSIVRGPAVIGPGATIEDAFIGPYTSIGSEVAVRRCEVEHSIVLANSTVEDLGTRMEGSLLGRNVRLTRGAALPKTLRLLVGDNSLIELQ